MSEKGFFGKAWEGAKGAAKGVAKVGRTIKRAIAFFSTFIGQIVFFLIAIALIGVLVYIIATVLVKDVAKIIGIEGGAKSGSTDYAYLKELASSGYDEMLSAEELVEYHAFEYAVLMDAARFMEETGTLEIDIANGKKIDFELLARDGIDNRQQWALLAAEALMSNYPDDIDANFASATREALGIEKDEEEDGSDTNESTEDTGGAGGSDDADISDVFSNVDISDFDKQHAQENLFYYPIYNQYTNERSLVPYLEITRTYDIVQYYIEFRNGVGGPANAFQGPYSESDIGGGSNINNGSMPGLPTKPNSNVSIASFNNNLLEYRARYMAETNATGTTNTAGTNNTSRPQNNSGIAHVGLQSNGAQASVDTSTYKISQSEAHGTLGDIKFSNGSTPENVDVNMLGVNFNLGDPGTKEAIINAIGERSRFEFGDNSKYYLGLSTAYEFIYKYLYPLEIVGELNAGNSFAYRDNDYSYSDAGGEVDLYKFYDETLYFTVDPAPTNHRIPLRILLDRFLPNAVLMSSWRLLKDDSATTEDVVKEIQKIYTEACAEDAGGDEEPQIFLVKDVNTVTSDIRETTDATTLFNEPMGATSALPKYLDGETTSTIYDSYKPLIDSRELVDPDSEGETDEEEELPTPGTSVQTFEGSLKDDIIDDIKLVLTHHSAYSEDDMAEFAYDKVINDAKALINPSDSQPKSDEQIIIYTPMQGGGYATKCEIEGNENPSHYSGANHISVNDPYSASENIQECFFPFLKVAYSLKKGFRMTSVIICYDGEYTAYVVKSREMDDANKIQNKKTFAYFESRDIQCTTVRHWVFTLDGEQADEKWFVQDAFEGLNLGMGDDYTLSIKYRVPGMNGTASLNNITYDKFNFSEDDIHNIIREIIVNGYAITDDNVLLEESLATVRKNEDGTNVYPSEWLVPPSNPSPTAEARAEYPGANFDPDLEPR